MEAEEDRRFGFGKKTIMMLGDGQNRSGVASRCEHGDMEVRPSLGAYRMKVKPLSPLARPISTTAAKTCPWSKCSRAAARFSA